MEELNYKPLPTKRYKKKPTIKEIVEETKKKDKKKQPKNDYFGIVELFVVGSIIYTSYIVIAGTTGLTPKIMVLPQAIFGGMALIRKFTK